MLKERYFRKCHLLHAKKPYSSSFGWKSIFSARHLLVKGLRKGLESGFNISIRNDPWLSYVHPHPTNGRGRYFHPNLKINHLIIPVTKEWYLPALPEFLNLEDVQLVQGLAISQTHEPYHLLWHHTKSIKYTEKS